MRLAMLAMLLATPAWAQQAPIVEQATVVQQAWARATSAAATTGAAYFTLRSASADALTGASTPAAAHASLHRSAMAGTVMQMRPVDALPLPAGQTVSLTPGGLHVMLEGLTQPLKPGDRFPLTLTFAHASPVTVEVTVRRAGASGAAMGGMDMSGPGGN